MPAVKRKNVCAPHGVLYYDLLSQSTRLGPQEYPCPPQTAMLDTCALFSRRDIYDLARCDSLIDSGRRLLCRIDNTNFSHPTEFRVALVHELGDGQVADRS